MNEGFVLSSFMQEQENGFYVFEPDFGEKALNEDTEWDEYISELMGFNPFSSDEDYDYDPTEYREKMRKKFLSDPFLQENISEVFLCKTGEILVKSLNPSSGKIVNTYFLREEVVELHTSILYQIFKTNPYIGFEIFEKLPFEEIEKIEWDAEFFGNKKTSWFKLSYLYKGMRFEAVFNVNKNKNKLKEIKEKFDLEGLIDETWARYKLENDFEAPRYLLHLLLKGEGEMMFWLEEFSLKRKLTIYPSLALLIRRAFQEGLLDKSFLKKVQREELNYLERDCMEILKSLEKNQKILKELNLNFFEKDFWSKRLMFWQKYVPVKITGFEVTIEKTRTKPLPELAC